MFSRLPTGLNHRTPLGKRTLKMEDPWGQEPPEPESDPWGEQIAEATGADNQTADNTSKSDDEQTKEAIDKLDEDASADSGPGVQPPVASEVPETSNSNDDGGDEWGSIPTEFVDHDEPAPETEEQRLAREAEEKAAAEAAARKEAEAKAQAEAEAKAQAEAAARIQAAERRRVARLEYEEKRKAAVRIQSRARGTYGRRKIKMEKDQTQAATKLQARIRGKQARKKIKDEETAAVAIQARVRGRQQRTSKERAEKDRAAARIQARARGRKARAQRMREDAAIKKIQAIERGRQTRKGMKQRDFSKGPSLINATVKGEDTTVVVQSKGGRKSPGFFQSTKSRLYEYPTAETLVADTGMQTQLLPPDAPPKTPNVIMTTKDVLHTYAKGIAVLFKAYSSKNGLNKAGSKPTFDAIRNSSATVDRAAFSQLCAHFHLSAPRQKKRLNARGKRLRPNADGWYRLWSQLPTEDGGNPQAFKISQDIRNINVQEIAKAANVDAGNRSEKKASGSLRNPKNRRALMRERRKRIGGQSSKSLEEGACLAIRFGQTVETAGLVASIDVLPEDVNTPPTLSDDGEIPMATSAILAIFNMASGSEHNYLGLDAAGLGQALAAIAYDGVRRLIPAEHLIRSEMRRNTARMSFFRQVLPTVSKFRWKPQFRHYTDFPCIKEYYEKLLRRQRRESRTHFTKSHRVFARVTKPWVPDMPTQRIAQNAYRRLYKGRRRKDGTPTRMFQQGGLELKKGDVVELVYRRTSAEQEEHIANLRDLSLDPLFGLVGPGRFLERPPAASTDGSLVKQRSGDWWLGSLVSYKGEAVEPGSMSGWLPASTVTVVKIEDLQISEDTAATMLQSATRGHLCRELNKKRWGACAKIQKLARGMIQRARFVRGKYVLRGVAEAIIAKRLMNLSKAQCTAAVFNRMRVGAATQLRRRIMAHNNGFSFGENNSSSVAWRVDELENDLQADEAILQKEINKTFQNCSDEFGIIRKDLTPAEQREVECKKLLIPAPVVEGDLMGRGGSRVGGDGERIGGLPKIDTQRDNVYAEDAGHVGLDSENMDTGLDEAESNWLDSIGKFHS